MECRAETWDCGATRMGNADPADKIVLGDGALMRLRECKHFGLQSSINEYSILAEDWSDWRAGGLANPAGAEMSRGSPGRSKGSDERKDRKVLAH